MTATAAGIRELVAAGDRAAAAEAAGRLIADGFGQPVAAVELTVDEYSLNSVSGRVHFADGHTEFFKFHAEEGEERFVVIQGEPEVLSATFGPDEGAVGHRGGEAVGAGRVPADGARVEHLGLGDRPADHMALEAGPDGLDFGQLRHRQRRLSRAEAAPGPAVRQ